ncbi:MAG: hypothetical protein ACOYM3_17340 [Terrimicrobiaceae bacterium]
MGEVDGFKNSLVFRRVERRFLPSGFFVKSYGDPFVSSFVEGILLAVFEFGGFDEPSEFGLIAVEVGCQHEAHCGCLFKSSIQSNLAPGFM